MTADFRCGLVTLLGATNVGKSTLVNRLLDFKVAITSKKPQTTRHHIRGVLTTDAAQTILIDTPGVHRPQGLLGKKMVQTAVAALAGVDLVALVADVTDRTSDDTRRAVAILKKTEAKKIAVINKIDLIDRPALLPLMEEVAAWDDFEAVIPVSARTGDGIDVLRAEIESRLPAGEPIFPADVPTDRTERFLIGELIREQIIRSTHQEVPYGTAVEIDRFAEPDRPNKPVVIQATIHVEQTGQKGIIIGRGGKMIKHIGRAARLQMERLLGSRVYLDLRVKVSPDWTRREGSLRRFGVE
jgi:GTP-binding protein Era